jgi:outer membrane protein OmpA-like peptidoglycan-associated protein
MYSPMSGVKKRYMKKIIYFCLLILFIKFNSFAQSTDTIELYSKPIKTPIQDTIVPKKDTIKLYGESIKTPTVDTVVAKVDSLNSIVKDTIGVVKTDTLKPVIETKAPVNTTVADNKSINGSASKDSVSIIIKNIGDEVNSPFPDYAPIISADGSMMIFTSKQPIGIKDSLKKSNRMENVFVSYYNDSLDKWTPSELLSTETVNQPKRNNSAIALSNDGQRLLLYKGEPDGNIYASSLVGKDWAMPLVLPNPINSPRHETSASIAPDGRTLYFVSDRKGGKGKLDIWMCKQDRRGNWGEAKNLGAEINTDEDEEGVFIHPDGKTLYFSSEGHDTRGGFDIFKSTLVNGKWTKAVNIGEPINTPGDDLYFVLTADGKTGYYASGRPGGYGDKDIYKITFNYPEDKKNESGLTLFKGVVIDYDSFQPLEAEMDIIDNDSNEVITSIKSNSVTGKFLISLPAGKNYGIAVRKDGYLFYSENFNIPESAAFQKIDKHVPLQKISIGNKITLKNIFYDYGKATVRSDSKSELDRLVELMKANANLRIEVASHTDSEGSDEYNLTLSQSRAQSVVDYLTSHGISATQLVAKGYGEKEPLFSNDTDAGREVNRRTEFKILNKE